MALREVQLPNNKIARVSVPDGTTDEQIEEFVLANYDEIVASAGEDYSQPNVQKQGDQNYAAGLAETALKGATLNMSDEIQGGIGAMFKGFMDMLDPNSTSDITGESSSFADDYAGVRDISRADQKQFAAENPKTAFATEMAASMLLPGAVAGKALQAPSIAGKATAVPGIFGLEGALSGFGAGEGMENSGLEALKQGTTAAVVGTTLNKLAKGVARWKGTKGAKKAQEASQKSTTLDDLKTARKEAYDVLDDSNLMIKESSYVPFRDDLIREIRGKGYRKGINSSLDSAVKELESINSPIIQDLERIRKMADVGLGASNTEKAISSLIRKGAKGIVTDVDPSYAQKIKFISPDVVARRSTNKLSGNSNALPHLAHATLQAIVDSKSLSNLSGIHILTLKRKTGVSR